MNPVAGIPSLAIEPTPYVRTVGGVPVRAFRLTIPVPFSGTVRVQHTTGGDTTTTEANATDGLILAYAPADFDHALSLTWAVSCAEGAWHALSTAQPARRWRIYIAQDKHLDYGWIHPVERVAERMNVLTDFYLDRIGSLGLRWNFDVAIWVEEFLDARPSWQAERLIEALRSGQFEVGGFWLVPFPGLMGTEEILQNLYYARRLEETWSIPVRTASLQEAPSLPWGLATILAGAGIPYIVKGAYDLRNPHLREREPLPLSEWEGPDGSRVTMKWDAYDNTNTWGGYAEAYRLWRNPAYEERIEFIEDTITRYELNAAYPFDAILLAGTGYDEYPQTATVSQFIQQFNSQGWEYPQLIDATWSQFWDDIEGQRESKAIVTPRVRGDWGTTWEEWPAQLARLNTMYRRARETVLTAQALTALAYHYDPDTHPTRRDALHAAWRGLLQFGDHNIGGITASLAEDMHGRKAMYVYTAAREGSRALDGGLSTLASAMPKSGPGERTLLVVNPDSWDHDGIVEVVVPEAGPYDVIDVESGGIVPSQIETRGRWPEHYLSFVARGIPGFGYRTYLVQQGTTSREWIELDSTQRILENELYRLTVDAETGGVRSLIDKTAMHELVNNREGCGFNQYLHFSDGQLHVPRLSSVSAQAGALGMRLSADIMCFRGGLRSTYLLYNDLPHVGIINELVKEPSAETQSSWFTFPLNLAGHRYYYDGPAAILRAGMQAERGDLLPGAGRTCVAVQSFVAATDSQHTATLATPDAHLFQFGRHILRDPLSDSDPRQPLALSLVMHNFTRNDHAVAQGGQAHFDFRYSISSRAEPFRGGAAVKFAKGTARNLPATWVTGTNDAPLRTPVGRLLHCTSESAIVTGLKVAEDRRGWVMRFWECDGRPAQISVDARSFGAQEAWHCDLLERDLEQLSLDHGVAHVTLRPRGLLALRLV
ncbi:MAG: hypothetical protein GX620_11185 [Chloroflexi bacterium]|nr:hypothetical protein [Chloroflexota bacterium]